MKLRITSPRRVLTQGIILGTIISATIVLTASGDPTNCAPSPAGLVSWWAAEGDAFDSTGTNNGTLQNGVGFATGVVGEAFDLNGLSQYVEVGNPSNLNPAASFSIEGWIYPRQDRAQVIISKWADSPAHSNQRSYVFQTYPGRTLLFGISDWAHQLDAGYHAFSTTNNVFGLSAWSHVAAVYDQAAGARRIYVNGVEVAERIDAPITVTNSTAEVVIGAALTYGPADGFFDGLIDELSFYAKALSAAEIQAIYNAGSAGKCPPAPPSIVTQPASQTVIAGSSAAFTVTASGTPPLSYQWRLNGTDIAGATGTSLTLSNVQSAQAGNYVVQVINAFGSVLSSNALLTVSNPPPVCAPPASGLVGWWPGEGNANDQVGTNSGSLLGQATFAPGLVGQAFSFNGWSGLVVVPDASALRFTNAMTIEAWVNPAANPQGYPFGIVTKWFGGVDQLSYSTAIEISGKAYLLVSKNGLAATAGVDYGIVYSANTVPLNQWTHFAATYDGAWLKVYLNGVLANQAAWTNGIFPGTAPLVIGANLIHSVFNGRIDEPAVYNRALSDTEIQAVYNAGSAGKCPPAPPSIVTQPASQTVIAGSSAAFTVTASGTPPLSYQWRLNGTDIAGATGTSLTLSNVQPIQAGNYAVQVINAFGSVLSSNALLTVSNPPPVCAPPASGLVGWWPSEGNANDQVGTNSGTLLGEATFAPGLVGQAFSFNGWSGSVVVPDAPALRFTNAMTIEAWVYPAANPQGYPFGIVTKWFGGVDQLSYSTAIEISGKAYLLVSKNGLAATAGVDYGIVYSANTVPLNQWTHFAATYDGAWLKVYLNGVLANQAAWTNGIFPGTAPLVIGANLIHSVFNGRIDEPAVYNRALSDTEIQAVYNAGSAGKCPPAPPSIVTQPASQTVIAGSSAAFTVTASGTPPLSYQWRLNGTNIAGATGTSFTLSNVQSAQAGNYVVQVINAFGSVLSSNALLTVSNPPPLCAPAASGLVGWWPGEGNANDQVGTNSGSLLGQATFAPGLVGQAFSFNGWSGLVVVPDASALRFTNAMTIEAWVNPAANPQGYPFGIVTKWFGDADQFSYSTAIDISGKVYLLVSKNGLAANAGVDYGIVYSANTVPLNQWTHFAATYDGAWLKVYLNGVLENQAAWTDGIFPGTAPLVIGANLIHSVFNGRIDEPAVYNRALSDTEIQAVYSAGGSGKCVTPRAPYIYAQPANQVITAGGSVTFGVGAGGTPPLSYQWSFGGSALDGATNASLTLTNVQFSQAGDYSVVITNAVGTAASSNATLSVNFPPASVRVVNVTNAHSGTTVIVPVSLAANGNENGLSFSLNFDTTKLTYVSTALGSGASGATLLTNAAQAASGKLGVMLALPPNQTFTAGTQEVVQVTFMSAVRTYAFSTTVSFGDVPIVRELSDAPGNVLAATYASGVILIQAADFEGDLAPRPNGDKAVTLTDWVTAGRYAARLDYPTNASEFQRADCAPRATLGDGAITVIDWVQVGLYAAHLDPLTAAGGPTNDVHLAGNGPGTDSTPRTPHGDSPFSRLLEVADTMVIQGLTGTASVQLESQGDENAAGFSLLFDPSAMNYVGASLGSAGNGATMIVNDIQAGAGRLGFVLGLGTRTSFVSGTRELVKVSFRAAAAAKGNCTVSFANQPVGCEVSGTNALPLAAGYVNGTITVNPLPSLSIGRSGEEITLAWPLWATNFGLQAAEGGLPPTVPWTNLVAVPTLTSNQAIVTLPLAGTNKVYRLHQP